MKDQAGHQTVVADRNRAHLLSDTELITAMRRDESFAFVEFIERFRHVAWNEARGLGVDAAGRKSWTEEVLHDCALALTQPRARLPANVAGYVVVAVRRRLFAERRKIQSEDRLLGTYADELSANEYDERTGMSAPLMKLAETLASQITDEEEALLEWKRRKLGYTQAALWLGVKRDTVAHRTLRLTARLQKAAQVFLESLSDEDVQLIQRFVNGQKGGDHER